WIGSPEVRSARARVLQPGEFTQLARRSSSASTGSLRGSSWAGRIARMRIVKLVVLSLAVRLIAASPAIGAPFSVDQVPGRLPKDVIPVRYEIAIVPNSQALSLTGRESVLLKVREATSTLKFNSLNETLHDVRFDGKPVKQVVSSDALQLTTVTLR